jgi:hypothetical protein
MISRIVHRTILCSMLASLPCFVTAAGSPGCDDAQAIGTDQVAYDYLANGAYYAPGSYSSWFYVSPPDYDVVPSAPSAPKTNSERVVIDLPAIYDYEPRWGPLVA